MRSSKSILALDWKPVSARGGARRAASDFLRYIHYRDKHVDSRDRSDIDRMTRYLAHRDRSTSKGRLFDARRVLSDEDRKRLPAYVERSTKGLPPLRMGSGGRTSSDSHRAFYRMIMSPENARGLDLRAVARAMMAQLDCDTGGLPPWIAAEHHNTAHHHVHIVLAARREVTPGLYRAVVITKPRLARMKAAMVCEIERQRELENVPVLPRARELGLKLATESPRAGGRLPSAALYRRGHRPRWLPGPYQSLFRRLRSSAARYGRHMQRELEEDRRQREWELTR